jgi:hypothetical protein
MTASVLAGGNPACDDAAGNCCEENGTPGCDDSVCCNLICDLDPFCCDVEWDGSCASAAVSNCEAAVCSAGNDECANAVPIVDGDTAYDSSFATDSVVPDLCEGCEEGSGLSFGGDIWFTYEASVTGTLTVSTCSQADYDSRLAAYDTCPTGLGDLIACNDDSAGCTGFTSVMCVPVTSGETILIRVGGFNGATGSGTLTLTSDSGCTPVNLDSCIDGTCPASLVAAVDLVAGTVDLEWNPAADLDATGIEVRRNGETIASLPLDAITYQDMPALPGPGTHTVISYEVATVGGSEGDLCAPLEASAVFSTGDVRLADDFESYATDAELAAAGWAIVDENNPTEDSSFTVTNPGGRGNPARFDGKASSGRFLISDSDIGGAAAPNPTGSGMSHDVWSPVFDCTGLDAVWLHLDCSALLNNNGKAVLDIDVTTNDGGTWLNVFRRVAPARTEAAPFATTDNADGYYGRLDVDLTLPAAGQPAVRFRVRHFEPNWDWWVAFDNVIVDDVDLGGGSTTLLPTQDFSTGLPPGWTIQGNNNGADTWTTTDPCLRSIVAAGEPFPYLDGRAVHRLGTDFMIMDSDCDPDPAENEWLVTPSIDCTTASRVYLHYKSEIITLGGAAEEVRLSLDGGATLVEERIFSYAGGGLTLGEDPAYAERVLEVPEAAGESDVAFVFRYAGGGNQWWWAVDDVSVTADGSVPGDANGDGVVDVSDLVLVIVNWGPCPPGPCPGDVTGDGVVDVADLIAVILGWS